MSGWLIVNARVVNEAQVTESDVRIRRGRIEQLASSLRARSGETLIDARGRYLIPGMIDNQVHFREPGQARKGTIASESRAAVAGGITTYLDMPDTVPPTNCRRILAEKFSRAAGRSAANFSFYLGTDGNNLDEIKALRSDEACGIQVGMDTSAEQPHVDDPDRLAEIFRHAPRIVAVRCADAATIVANLAAARQCHGGQIPAQAHAGIRSAEASRKSAALAVALASKHGTDLHILNIGSHAELPLLVPGAIAGKTITADACIAQLYFIDADIEFLGNLLKCNPPIRTSEDRSVLRRALKTGRLDMIATGHAPHLRKEKGASYESAPAGLPLVQFALPTAWSLVASRVLSPAELVEKIAHNPARRFAIADRGFVREGYWADLVLLDPATRTDVDRQPQLSQCGWTPFAGRKLPAQVAATWVNGRLVWRDGLLTGIVPGMKLEFSGASMRGG
jgi:dihydroorotase